MISREEVIRIAELSRLSFTEEEIEKYRSELESILNYTEVLNKYDLKDVKPTATSSELYNVFREDEVKPSLTRQEVLQNAKDKDYGCFHVSTKVVE